MNKVKKADLKKMVFYPIAFGLLSFLFSFTFAQILSKVVFSIPHYESTKDGTFGILLSIILGFPFGVALYVFTLPLRSLKKRVVILVSSSFMILMVINLYDLVDSSCLALKKGTKWNKNELSKNKSKYKAWNNICN